MFFILGERKSVFIGAFIGAKSQLEVVTPMWKSLFSCMRYLTQEIVKIK